MNTKSSHQVLGVDEGATLVQIKEAFKRMSLLHHPDRVPVHQRKDAEARFSQINSAYRDLLHEHGQIPGEQPRPINPATVHSMRAARDGSSKSKFVWASPVVIPLLLTFGFLTYITYQQISRAAESTRRSARPYGLLGPTVNEFLDQGSQGDNDKFKSSSNQSESHRGHPC